MRPTRRERRHCPACSAPEDELHEIFCTKELCPFCRGQLASCRCIVTVLKLNDEERKAVEEYRDDTVEPLAGIVRRWKEALRREGRIPFGWENLW